MGRDVTPTARSRAIRPEFRCRGWISPPGEYVVEDNSDQQHHSHVEQHGGKHELVAKRLNLAAADDCRKRRCTTGRVDAAHVVHRGDRESHGNRARYPFGFDQLRTGHADGRGQQVAPDQGPGL